MHEKAIGLSADLWQVPGGAWRRPPRRPLEL